MSFMLLLDYQVMETKVLSVDSLHTLRLDFLAIISHLINKQYQVKDSPLIRPEQSKKLVYQYVRKTLNLRSVRKALCVRLLGW